MMNYQDLLQISLPSFSAHTSGIEMFKIFTKMAEVILKMDRKDDFFLKFIIIQKKKMLLQGTTLLGVRPQIV